LGVVGHAMHEDPHEVADSAKQPLMPGQARVLPVHEHEVPLHIWFVPQVNVDA
jgi:hypothetical protein